MTVIVIQQAPATEEQYRAVNDAMDLRGNPPAGLILHTAGALENGDLRVVDIWESAEAFQTFASERLVPTITQIAGDNAPTARIEIRELYDVIHGAG